MNLNIYCKYIDAKYLCGGQRIKLKYSNLYRNPTNNFVFLTETPKFFVDLI